MLPVALAFMAVGSIMQGASKAAADHDQANAERGNAAWYRKQADYAEFAGDRELMLFDRSSKVTYGEQRSAFAKSGVDTAESSRFLAQQELFGQQQSYAINREKDMNVELATLKANQADNEAFKLDASAQWDMLSGVMGAGSAAAQSSGSMSGYGLNSGLGGKGGSGPGIFTRVS